MNTNRETNFQYYFCEFEKLAYICELPASLKDDTANMNDRNKHKITEQMNHQTTDPKANASVFLFFPTVHFLKTILVHRTNGTFAFAPTAQLDTQGKIKRAVFWQRNNLTDFITLDTI